MPKSKLQAALNGSSLIGASRGRRALSEDRLVHILRSGSIKHEQCGADKRKSSGVSRWRCDNVLLI
ncbi:hypothetical protein EYF80_030448 [Liparis tanakae]|uniref:Uncharacterized protein n=1 Tax=Liparis tanakae TaxID=230148 RepID=A0A4Z2H223_9TELE|nr:hypothetical protein EYF80_030448 [Liparis tanakae]